MTALKRFESFNESDNPLNDAVDTETLPKKGLLVYVYRSPLGDSTAGGITSKFDKVVIVGSGIPEVFLPSNDAPAVYLDTINAVRGRKKIYASPVDKTKEKDGTWMFGGNFIYSSDSRFVALTDDGNPIPVHDRFEDWDTYDRMSK